MKKEIMYIEKYFGTNHNGPAWIAFVSFSKSGRTIYFNGKALKKYERGMYYDIETSEDYWITGIKRKGTNRHWAGSGIIMVDKNAIQELKRIKDTEELNSSIYEIVEISETSSEDIKRLSLIENEKSNKDEK